MTATTISYRATWPRGIPPLADVYVPQRPTGVSAVLVHGGGLVIGSRRMPPMRYLARELSAAGIAVCAIDYRLLGRGGFFSAALDDVCTAIAFWRRHAVRLGLDAAAITLVGLSAGATLALHAAEHQPVASLACCFGVYGPRAARPPAPTLLLHGEADRLVSVRHSRRLADARGRLGLPTRLVTYAGARHGFFTVPSSVRDAATRELVDHLVRTRQPPRDPAHP